MFGGIGFGAERIGLAVLKFPKTALVFMLSLIALIGASLPHVAFDDDINRVFLSDSQLSDAQRNYELQQSPPTTTILVHITAPAALTASNMTALRELSEEFEDFDGVNTVVSPFSIFWPAQDEDRYGEPVLEEPVSENFSRDIAEFEALETGLPTFVSQDRMTMIINIIINLNETNITKAIETIQAELDKTLPASLSVNITGEDVVSTEIVSGLKNDLISLNILGALLVTFAAFLLLRDFRMAFLAVAPAIIGAAGILALSVWLGYPITVLSNVIPILILVLGVANGMHLAGHIKDGGSLRDSIIKVAPACALTALTTATAFSSIMLTGNEQMFEFAVLGAVGTIFAFVIVIIAFALLGHVVKLSARPVPKVSEIVAHKLAGVGSRWPRATLAACAALLVISVIGFTQTKAWFPLYQNLPDDSATIAINDAISDEFGGVFTMIVETDEDWPQTQTLTKTLQDISGPQTVLSEVSLATWFGHPETPLTEDELEDLPKEFIDLLRGDGDLSRILVSVAEPMRNEQSLAEFDALYAAATEAGASKIFGLPTIMRKEAVRLINQLSFGLVLAALGAVFICALAFKSARLIPVLIIPNILPLMLTGASLHLWAQGQLSPTAVLALTIAFGIAIDDSVHFLSRFSAAKARGEPSKTAVVSATNAAGQVIVLTTLLLTIGMSVTMISGFTPIRLFGGMMIVTLWAALLIDLLLLPALLTWKRTSQVLG